MKREDAVYYKNLLRLGFLDDYAEWLNHKLELEDPLSDIVLDLSYCSSDVNKTISVLHDYCAEQPFDEDDVFDRLRLFFKDAYYSNRMTKEEIVSAMYRLVLNIDERRTLKSHLWSCMYYLDDYYYLAQERVISWESFDFAFFSYLDDGIPVDSDRIWEMNTK